MRVSEWKVDDGRRSIVWSERPAICSQLYSNIPDDPEFTRVH